MRIGDWVKSRTLGWVGEIVDIDEGQWMNRVEVRWHTGLFAGELAHPHNINLISINANEARQLISQERKRQ